MKVAPFLKTGFFERDVLSVASDLIGVELVWRGCSGVIVETEAYAAEDDEACHTFSRQGAREFVRVMPPGTAYVYLNYGMYWLFNLLVKGGGRDGLVLVRALEPRLGVEQMMRRRNKQRVQDLCSGPGKASMALGVTGAHHGTLMAGRGRPEHCGLRPSDMRPTVVTDIRVGISRAVDRPWRFLAANHPHVSVPPGRVRKP
jgi:DNA-3-methyladenine glycosylase